MIKRVLSVFVIVLAAAGAMAQPEDNAMRRSIAEYYTKLAKAISAKDIKAGESMITGDYVNVDKEGKARDRATCLAGWKQFFGMCESIKCTVRLRHVQLQSKEASAWYEMTTTAVMKQGAKKVSMTWTARYCDTLQMHGPTWRAAYTMELMTDEPWNFPTTGGGG